MSVAIKIENVSKLYRLGTVGTGTIAHDLNRWWHQIRGKEDPYAKIGQVNDRTKKSGKSSVDTRQSSANAASANSVIPANCQLATDDSACQLPTDDSRASGPEYVWALRDINLEVQQGEILGIIGRNGAGKSTLLKILSRVTAPTTGSIKTKGRIASLLEVGTGFHPELTGRENIYMNGAILGMRRHEITRQLDEIVEFSGCEKYLDTPVKRYSSGMTVRLGFAVAAHLECEILIVDEVLAVGDAEFQKKSLRAMESVASQGRTVLFVSHSMAAISRICSHAITLESGTSLRRGSTNEIIRSYLQSSLNSLVSRFKPCVSQSGLCIHEIALHIDGADNGAVLHMGQEISFHIRFSNDSDIHSLSVGLVIYDQSAIPVLNTNNTYQKMEPLATASKTGSVDCNLGRVPFIAGTYTASFWIELGPGQTSIFRNALSFQVLPKNLWGTAGNQPPAVASLWWPTAFSISSGQK